MSGVTGGTQPPCLGMAWCRIMMVVMAGQRVRGAGKLKKNSFWGLQRGQKQRCASRTNTRTEGRKPSNGYLDKGGEPGLFLCGCDVPYRHQWSTSFLKHHWRPLAAIWRRWCRVPGNHVGGRCLLLLCLLLQPVRDNLQFKHHKKFIFAERRFPPYSFVKKIWSKMSELP